MTTCIYTTDGPPWRCTRPGCGHKQSVTQTLRRNNCGSNAPTDPRTQTLHHNCRSPIPSDTRAYLEAAIASDVVKGLSSVTPKETARRIERCVECPSLVNQACTELFHASGECRAKANRYHVRRLLGRWTACERMTEVDSS